MSMITEQVESLRDLSEKLLHADLFYVKTMLKQAADTIEQLAAKVRAENNESQPCEDAISRQAVIDAMYALCNTGETLKENPWRDNPHIDAITDAIEDLPLVHSQPNKEDIHREREQAYMCGFEDGSRKYRTEPCDTNNEVGVNFPETWEEYEQYYGFDDTEEVYSNNIRLIPSFRVKQWLEHINTQQKSEG